MATIHHVEHINHEREMNDAIKHKTEQRKINDIVGNPKPIMKFYKTPPKGANLPRIDHLKQMKEMKDIPQTTEEVRQLQTRGSELILDILSKPKEEEQKRKAFKERLRKNKYISSYLKEGIIHNCMEYYLGFGTHLRFLFNYGIEYHNE